MSDNRWVVWVGLVLCGMMAAIPVRAELHPVVEQVLAQSTICAPNYYFSSTEIASKNSRYLYLGKISQLTDYSERFPDTRLGPLRHQFTHDLVILPVNRCTYRGNRNSFKNLQALERFLGVHRFVNTDVLVHKTNERFREQHPQIDYHYLPMNPIRYPRHEDLESLLQALSLLAEGTPENPTYLSCFFGKHRTGLLIGLYQFLGEYAQDPQRTCQEACSKDDRAYMTMYHFGNSGSWLYDMPSDFLRFYQDFTEAVCAEQSAEFLNGLVLPPKENIDAELVSE